MDLRGKTNYPKSVIIVIHIQQVQLYTCLYFKNFRLTEYHVRLAVVKNELLIKAAPALVSDKVAPAVQCKACTGFRLILFSENIWDGYERGNWLWLNHLQEVNPILHLAFAIHRNRTTTKQERELSELLQVDIEEGEPTPLSYLLFLDIFVICPVSKHFFSHFYTLLSFLPFLDTFSYGKWYFQGILSVFSHF